MKRSQVEVRCFFCRHKFKKRRADYNRTERRGSRHFCGRRCAIAQANSEVGARGNSEERIAQYADNQRNDLTPFRWFIARVRYRCKGGRRQSGIDAEYLKELWDKQNGICPVTGWVMVLPPSSYGWRGIPREKRASLDRIDSSLGYLKGNVQFVVEMANLAKNRYKHEQLYEFCRAVARLHP